MIKILRIQIIFIFRSTFFITIFYIFNFHYKNFHPLILISILILILLIASINIRIYFNDHWFSFIIFLIIVGGLIIIFLYFIRFINNIKTSIKWDFLKNIPIKFLFIIIVFILFWSNSNNWFINFDEITPLHKKLKKLYSNNLIFIYIFPKNYTTIIAILYLLISLTIVVKICLLKKFTLRKFNYEKINL